MAAGLLRAGLVLRDVTLVDEAARRGRLVAMLPFRGPDLYTGAAGRLRLHLRLWEATGDRPHLDAAVAAGEWLLGRAVAVAPGRWCWIVREADGSSRARTAYVGYAHGAAGIADCLIDLFEATGRRRYREAARRASRWVVEHAVSVSQGGRGLGWSVSADDPTPFSPFWCHGAAGVGGVLLRCARHDLVPGAASLVRRAAWSAARDARWAPACACHGLAGNIHFLLDAYRLTGERAYYIEALGLGALLAAAPRDERSKARNADEHAGPSLLLGDGGVALACLRLGRSPAP